MAVRDDDHGARAAVDHPLGSRAGSNPADHAAGRRADDGEARVLGIDHALQRARHAHRRRGPDDARAHVDAVVSLEVGPQGLEPLADQAVGDARAQESGPRGPMR